MVDKLNELFEELVPAQGSADTKAGELVRAVSRIGYRFYNDGDRIGVGYGNEVCNPAARYIVKEFPDEVFARTINGMWGLADEAYYEKGLNMLVGQVVRFIEDHPELKEEKNEIDFNEYYYDDADYDYEEEEPDESTVFVEPWAVYDP